MLDDERRAVARRAADLADRTPGRSGNLSVRSGDRFAVTPTGVAYAGLESDDVPVVGLDGERLAGALAPSSETPMHAAIYRELGPGAVVHAHAPWATALAALRRPVPPVHYALARAGGRVPVADYATYGSDALAANVVSAMAGADTTACLLANHGVVATGDDLDAAIGTLDAVEFTAQVFARAASVGEPVELPADELDRVAERFASYGQD
ncbi:MAG: class II aldolase/adducin family protein [Halobacteriales archaeon]